MTVKAGGVEAAVTGTKTAGNTQSKVAQQQGALLGGAGTTMSSADKEGEGKRCVNGHPVDVFSGEVVDEMVDLSLPGLLPIELKRIYSSAWASERLPYGHGWTFSLHQYLEMREGVLGLRDYDGRWVELGNVAEGERTLVRRKRLQVERLRGDRYELREVRSTLVRVFDRDGDSGRHLLRAIRDPRGNRIELIYEQQRLAKIVDTAGREIRFSYDAKGRITEAQVWVDDSGYQQVRYAYTEVGELSAAENALGHRDRYHYDGEHRMVQATLKNGVSFYYRYDDNGQCIKTWGDGGLYTFEFEREHSEAGTVVRTAGTPEPREYAFDERGALLSEKSPDGSWEEQYTYDDDLLLLSEYEAGLGTTHHRYDERGRRVSMIDPAGNAVSWEYSDEDRLLAWTDPDGLRTAYSYDGYGDLIAAELRSGESLTLEYDRSGRLTAVNGVQGRLFGYQYDAQHNLATITNARGSSWQFSYDAQGRPLTQTDPQGQLLRAQYDALGQATQVERPDGSVVQYGYGPLGCLTQEIDGLGRVTRMDYIGTGKLARRQEPDGSVWELTYDTLERVLRIKNPKAEIDETEYDECGRVIVEKTFDGRRLRYAYTGNMLLRRVERPDGSWREYERDPLGNVLVERSPHGARTFERDSMGRVLKAVASDVDEDQVVEFERDALGRIICEIQGEHHVAYSYDQAGHRVSRSVLDEHVTRYQYDEAGWLSRLDHNGYAIDFSYDALGRERRRMAAGGKVVVDSWHDGLDRLVGQRASARSGADWETIAEQSWRYDHVGRLTEKSSRRWGGTTYAYGPGDHVVGARSQQAAEQYDYDAAGAVRQALSSLHTGALPQPARPWRLAQGNVLRESNTHDFEVDELNRRVSKTDANSGEETRYLWDCRDQLRDVALPDGSTARYRYDAFGRRVRKEVTRPSGDGDTIVSSTTFVWDGDAIAAEVRSDGSRRVHVHNDQGTVPILQIEQGATYLVVTDHLGTPTELIDANGHCAWAARHTVWGQLVEHEHDTGSDVCSPFRGMGHYWDEETGLSATRHRMWDPATAHWLTADPLGLAGGVNLFGYDGCPLFTIDPLGLDNKSDSAALRRNLENNADTPSPFPNAGAHHIVESNDPAMKTARDHVKSILGDINHHENGVYLARGSAHRRSLPPGQPERDALPHSWVHNNVYKEYVTQEVLKAKTKTGLIRKLRKIKRMIMSADETLMTESQKKRRKAQDAEDAKKTKKTCSG